MVAEHILTLSDLQFQDILNNYKAEKDSGEFYGDWDPNAIKTKRQLALEIKRQFILEYQKQLSEQIKIEGNGIISIKRIL